VADRAESRISTALRRSAQRLDDLSFRLESALGSQFRLRQLDVASLAAAVLRRDPRQALAQARERLLACRVRLGHSIERLHHVSAANLAALDARLHSLSPLAVLDRGYALVLSAAGSLIRSAAQLTAGDRLTTRLADGTFTSRVEATASRAEAAAHNATPRH
jgi:exodeoxyribonuclease VII large subunit